MPLLYVSAVGNSELRWEKVNTMDIGYEFGMFDNRLALEIDLYKKTTNDLLLNALLPPTTGFSSATKNIGKLENKGLEVTLNTTNIVRKNISWSSNFNISFNRNKILELTRGQKFITAN
jgi:outer membrane receptor protein involved in Fe transport